MRKTDQPHYGFSLSLWPSLLLCQLRDGQCCRSPRIQDLCSVGTRWWIIQSVSTQRKRQCTGVCQGKDWEDDAKAGQILYQDPCQDLQVDADHPVHRVRQSSEGHKSSIVKLKQKKKLFLAWLFLQLAWVTCEYFGDMLEAGRLSSTSLTKCSGIPIIAYVWVSLKLSSDRRQSLPIFCLYVDLPCDRDEFEHTQGKQDVSQARYVPLGAAVSPTKWDNQQSTDHRCHLEVVVWIP